MARKLCATMSIPIKPKLEHTNPPRVPPSPPSIGPFCIRAHCTLSQSEDKLADVTGYDTDYSIVQRTQNACARLRKGKAECDEADITIIPAHKIRSCEGHIVHQNHETGITSIMFPK